jgi:hypothetical protein
MNSFKFIKTVLTNLIYKILSITFFWIPFKTSQPFPKPAEKTIMTQLIRSVHTDSSSTAFAGQILAWMDICGGVAARRFKIP